jgi:hypothetical protein
LNLFFFQLIFQPWRWRRYVAPKRRLVLNTALYPRRWYSS